MTTIGPSLVITGDVTSQEDVTIHGHVKGHIHMTQGALLLAPKGSVEADVHGTNITIHGAVTGDVAAARIELTPTAAVTGTLTGPSIVLQEGATFNGLIDMGQRTAAKTGPRAVVPVTAQTAAPAVAHAS